MIFREFAHKTAFPCHRKATYLESQTSEAQKVHLWNASQKLNKNNASWANRRRKGSQSVSIKWPLVGTKHAFLETWSQVIKLIISCQSVFWACTRLQRLLAKIKFRESTCTWVTLFVSHSPGFPRFPWKHPWGMMSLGIWPMDGTQLLLQLNYFLLHNFHGFKFNVSKDKNHFRYDIDLYLLALCCCCCCCCYTWPRRKARMLVTRQERWTQAGWRQQKNHHMPQGPTVPLRCSRDMVGSTKLPNAVQVNHEKV